MFLRGEQSAPGDWSFLWLLGAAFVLGAAATAVLSVRAVLWYALVWAGFAAAGALLGGLGLLVDLAEDFPVPIALAGFAVTGAALVGALLLAVNARPWTALIVLTAAAAVGGLSAVLALEEAYLDLTARQNLIVAVAGTTLAGGGGLALLTLAPITAAHASDWSILQRLAAGGLFVGLGGAALYLPGVVVHLWRESR
ncbi:hypothetical protein M1L60_13845 [Actinoplanes sp. TRM 88003]|uniref:Uncharacterized protein n=1 Tax=Paractinoplanes aksuensis TaxID=2939490 RepID=A0ABT1DLF9_9ACTN|nr:hypothetical protein [Actinoplanes aksuensis]MCO8271674.1 hypothetical protein [Actinoplanes aksuensis]